MTSGTKFIAWAIGGVILFIVVLMSWPFTSVDTGERGVVTRFGQVTGTLDEGLHFVNPFTTQVHSMDVKVQKEEVNASAASKDLQDVNAKVALNYHLDRQAVSRIFQTVGEEYPARIISPALQESVKAATARYTAEELITKRPAVRDDIIANLRAKLSEQGLIVDEFNIIDFGFSTQFNAAIESKVKAEQDAKTAQNKLVQVQAEAAQKVAQAQAEAESIRLQGNAANSENYIRLKQLEVELERAKRWNGVLPSSIYGTAPIPFLNVGQ